MHFETSGDACKVDFTCNKQEATRSSRLPSLSLLSSAVHLGGKVMLAPSYQGLGMERSIPRILADKPQSVLQAFQWRSKKERAGSFCHVPRRRRARFTLLVIMLQFLHSRKSPGNARFSTFTRLCRESISASVQTTGEKEHQQNSCIRHADHSGERAQGQFRIPVRSQSHSLNKFTCVGTQDLALQS